MQSSGYNDAIITPTYNEVEKRCGGKFEEKEKYSDIIKRQIEKMYLSSEIDEAKDGVRRNFRLFPVMLLYKVLIELGRTTGEYKIDMAEYRYVIATTNVFQDYLDALLLVKLMRQEPESKNKFEEFRLKFDNSHAAIISKETFDMVQQEFQNRQSLRSTGETGCGKFSGKYPFSGMIVCGECGETYRRHQQYNKYKKYYIWVCKRHENNGAEYCKSRPIKEEALEKAFVRALNELIGDKERILEKLQSATMSEITDSCATAINEVNAEIEKLQEQMMELLMKRNNGEITDKEYEQQSQQVGMKIDQLLMRKEEILSEQGKVQLASYRIEEVTKLLQTGKILEEFDRVMFKSLVRKITVLSNKEIEIEFECGITVRETL